MRAAIVCVCRLEMTEKIYDLANNYLKRGNDVGVTRDGNSVSMVLGEFITSGGMQVPMRHASALAAQPRAARGDP